MVSKPAEGHLGPRGMARHHEDRKSGHGFRCYGTRAATLHTTTRRQDQGHTVAGKGDTHHLLPHWKPNLSTFLGVAPGLRKERRSINEELIQKGAAPVLHTAVGPKARGLPLGIPLSILRPQL